MTDETFFEQGPLFEVKPQPTAQSVIDFIVAEAKKEIDAYLEEKLI